MKNENEYYEANEEIKKFLLSENNEEVKEFFNKFALNTSMVYSFRNNEIRDNMISRGIKNAMVNRLSFREYEGNIKPFVYLKNLIVRGMGVEN